ncbi:histidyl-tRNA synthetase [Thermoplasmatales archaeon SG8-52-2]|nr:MAG: histidyl-tRNA synthetase [Thermoplasmatales archaeon SG8-52-2]
MFKLPRGTRDFTSKEMQKRRYIENIMRSTFLSYGYKEIQTPTFETLELFKAKSGQEILDELYFFNDKSNRELALRPELTAPVIRLYVDKLQMEPKPLKLFYFGNCYRYDRPQKGRYREFTQAGCEIIGTDTPEALAELISLAYNILTNAGIKNLKLNIGNLNILSSIFNQLKLTKDQKKYIIPLIDKSLFDDVYAALKDFSIDTKDAENLINFLQTSDINIIKKSIKKESAKEELVKLEKILLLLENAFGIKNFQIQMSIVRGLDYYRGVVFEIEAPILGAEKQLCGGGAYDLISLFGGRDSPTAGFAIGFDRTIVTLESEEFNFPKTKIDVFIVSLDVDLIEKSINIAQTLREQGLTVDLDLMRRGLGKSLKYASSINAKNVIIIGSNEVKQDSVTIRNMETGDQKLIKIKDIEENIK